MSLVLIHAQAPWGPISLRTAADMPELLVRLQGMPGSAPAHVEDVGERDPADVVREALRLLPPPMDATGLIPATVEKARISVVEAVSRVLARVVMATEPIDDPPESSAGDCGAMVPRGEAAEEFRDRYAQALVRDTDNVSTANDSTVEHARRRLGMEVDAKAIRAGVGLSQTAFAKTFGIPLATLRDWEQGRNKPEGATRVLLMTIAHRPDAVRAAVEVYG